MRHFISFKIGSSPIEDGRIEHGHLVIRLPADFPPDFKGRISVRLESTKVCGCLADEACGHDHSGCGTPCGAPDCNANVESRFEPHPDCDSDGIGIGGEEDNCVAGGDTFCSTEPTRDWPLEWTDGLDNDCDGTADELPATPPAM